ncbi:MAG: TolC family protein, partial [Acidobacteriota bacterium]
LDALAAAVRQARQERELAARAVQFPELTAGWQRIDEGGVAHWGVLAGVQWRLPLPGPTRAGMAAAQAELAAAQGKLQLGRARAEAELASAREVYGTLRATAAAATTATTDAEPMVTAAVASFAAGESGVTDLLDTLRAAFELRRGAVEAHGRALAAHRELEQTCGRELPLGGQP